jgi:hypothetical protein
MTDRELLTLDYMPAMTMVDVARRRNMLVEFVKSAMTPGTDFGVIPGTGTKPTLLKPGAEKLNTLFGLSPMFMLLDKVEDWTGEAHGGEMLFYYRYGCSLSRGERLMGSGEGSCNSWEKKYRYRSQDRTCPTCGKATIIKGKAEYGGGFICFTKKGGCGAKFKDTDKAITYQTTGQVKNADIADQINTLQNMAQKRALVAATLIAVNASEFFTQDVEDMQTIEGDWTEAPAAAQDPAKTPAPIATPAEQSAHGSKLWQRWYALVQEAQALQLPVPTLDDAAEDADIVKAGKTLGAQIKAAKVSEPVTA